jgi:hypothetical protein
VNREADAKALYSWLSRFKGQFDMPGCHVEIVACDPSSLDDNSLIGEVYIVGTDKREAYIPVAYIKTQPAELKTVVDASKRIVNYIKVDRYYEPEFGKTEIAQLELRVDQKTGALRRLDIGTYSTNKALHQPNGNQSRWYNCGDSYLAEH